MKQATEEKLELLRSTYRKPGFHPNRELIQWLLQCIDMERMTVPLSSTQRKQVDEFRKKVEAKVLKKQVDLCETCKGEVSEDCIYHCTGHPYAGAIGGATTYHITPTGMGLGIEVEVWGEKLDVSEW